MSNSVDNRIVKMSFDSSKFQNGVKGVLDGLKRIDTSLAKERTLKGLDGMSKSMSDLADRGMSALTKGINDVSGQFSALDVVAVTALGNITVAAMDAGAHLLKSLALDPIMDGFREYETKMNSISTILTNTQSKGTTIDDITAALAELNEYSDRTIYNFAQMTDNIGKVTAAGLDLEQGVNFVKGMANTAAAFGVDANNMARATYQMTQAMASGYVKAQDWMSMEQAGMAGELLQDKLIAKAKEAGVSVDLVGKSFKESLKDGWLTADMYASVMDDIANDETLTQKAGEVTSLTKLFGTLQESIGSGWSETFEQILGGKEESTKLFTSINNAINDGIVTPLTDARKEVIATWEELGGRTDVLEGFKNIWLGLSRIIGPIGEAFNKIFPKSFGQVLAGISKGFRDLTYLFIISEGQTRYVSDAFTFLFKVIQGLGKVVGLLLTPLKHVFRLFADLWRLAGSLVDVFIRMLYSLGDYIRELTIVKQAQKLFNDGLEFIRKNVDKFVSAFDKGAQNVRDFFTRIRDGLNGLFRPKKNADEVAKSLDSVTKSAGESAKAMDKNRTVGDFIADTFKGIREFGSDIKDIFNNAKEGAENAADGFIQFVTDTKDYIMNSGIVVRATEMMIEAWDALGGVADKVKGFIKSIDFSPIMDSINYVKEKIEPVVDYVVNIFNIFKDAFTSLFDQFDLTGGQFIALIGGFVAGFGVFKVIASIADLLGKVFNPIGTLSEAAAGVLQSVGDVLKAYQNQLQAKTLQKIAISVLMLSGALLVLSQLDIEQAKVGLLGVAGLLTSVIVGLAALIKVTSGVSLLSFFGMSGAFVALAAAILAISLAISLLGMVGMEQVATGLLAIAGGVAIMTVALSSVSKIQGPVVRIAFAMMLLASAMTMMYTSLLIFSLLDTSEMNQSLLSVGASLGILVLACRGLDKITGNIPKTAFGLMLLSGALMIMASACRKFGKIDYDVLKQGLFSIGLIIGALSIFSMATSKSTMSFSMGTGMIALASALKMLLKPLKTLGEMPIGTLVKGIISMGATITTLALATELITPKDSMALIGYSVGLVLFAGAIKSFIKATLKLKDIPHDELLKGLTNIGMGVAMIGVATAITKESQMWSMAGGIIALSVAFVALGKAVEICGSISIGKLIKGFAALAGGLLVLEGAMRLTNNTELVKMSGGLIALSGGFAVLSVAIRLLGSIDFLDLVKGLGAMFGILGMMKFISSGFGGGSLLMLSAGVGAMAVALTGLTIPLLLLGNMDLKSLGIGLLGIAGILVILAGAAFIMTPLVPVLMGIASSVLLLGTGLLSAAGGLTLFSAGFALFGLTAATFGTQILNFLVEFSKRLPELATNLGLALVALLDVIGQNADGILNNVKLILSAILQACIDLIPLVADAVTELVIVIVTTIANNVDRLYTAGTDLLIKLLDGFSKHIQPIIDKTVEVLVKIANCLVENVNILVDAGFKLIIEMIQGMADAVDENSEALSEAVNDLIYEVLEAMVDLGKGFFKRGGEFIGEMIGGIFDKEDEVEEGGEDVAKSGVKGAETTKKSWKAAGASFSEGVEAGIYSGEAGVVQSAKSVARAANRAFKSELDINSPSKVTTRYGEYTSEGLSRGIRRFGHLAEEAAEDVANDTVKSIKRPFNNIALLDGIDVNPVVRPIMDLSDIRRNSRTIGDIITGATGSIKSFGRIDSKLATSIGVIQNGNDNTDIVSAISKLRSDIQNIKSTTNIIEGITYDDGSTISNTISDLVRMARVERRR